MYYHTDHFGYGSTHRYGLLFTFHFALRLDLGPDSPLRRYLQELSQGTAKKSG